VGELPKPAFDELLSSFSFKFDLRPFDMAFATAEQLKARNSRGRGWPLVHFEGNRNAFCNIEPKSARVTSPWYTKLVHFSAQPEPSFGYCTDGLTTDQLNMTPNSVPVLVSDRKCVTLSPTVHEWLAPGTRQPVQSRILPAGGPQSATAAGPAAAAVPAAVAVAAAPAAGPAPPRAQPAPKPVLGGAKL